MSRWIRIILRVALGAIFVYAAWLKLREPWQIFAMAVDAYKLLPTWGVTFVARTLPWAELVIGLLLISGFFLRIASIGASALLLGFFTVMVRTYAAGIQADCGCFGSGDPISMRTLTRDGTMLLASLSLTALAIWSRRRPALKS